MQFRPMNHLSHFVFHILLVTVLPHIEPINIFFLYFLMNFHKLRNRFCKEKVLQKAAKGIISFTVTYYSVVEKIFFTNSTLLRLTER